MRRLLPMSATVGSDKETSDYLKNKKMVTLPPPGSKRDVDYLKSPVYGGKISEVYYEIDSNDHEIERRFGDSIISVSSKGDDPVKEYTPRRNRRY